MKYLGIDGCRSGWFCIELGEGPEWEYEVVTDPEKLVKLADDAELALIDIPIGLVDIGTQERICDKEARRVLGAPRASSVFPAPARSSLFAASTENASTLNHKLTGRKLSRQSWALAPKIREIDQLMRSHSDLNHKLRECHPEVCFWALGKGQAMEKRKKIKPGRDERISVLNRYIPQASAILDSAGRKYRRREVAWDDIIDALGAAVTAKFGQDQLSTLPDIPPIDKYGLAMEIAYARPV